MSDVRPALSVVVPSYNEAESLAATFDSIVAALPDPSTSEIVLVDDGSTDATVAIMRELADSGRAQVRVVVRAANGGMGQALASGFAEATGEILTWIPGDGEYDLDEILAELDLLGSSDIVLFRRKVRDQLGRNIVSSLMYALIRVLFRFDARGYCGIFLIGRTRLESLEIRSRDVFFTLEVAIRAACGDWRIAYGFAEWRPRRAGRSKVFKISTVLRNARELLLFRVVLFRESRQRTGRT